MFGLGTGEIFLILVITMMVVGPERMVELSSQFGRAIAKFRAQTDEVTKEFREAFTLESGEEDAAESTGQTVEAQVSSGSEEIVSAERTAPGGLPAEVADAVPTEPALLEAPDLAEPPGAPVFVDGEIEIMPLLAGDATEGGEAALDEEPVAIQVAELVPEDEDVEPTVIEGAVLVRDEDVADDASQSEGEAVCPAT